MVAVVPVKASVVVFTNWQCTSLAVDRETDTAANATESVPVSSRRFPKTIDPVVIPVIVCVVRTVLIPDCVEVHDGNVTAVSWKAIIPRKTEVLPPICTGCPELPRISVPVPCARSVKLTLVSSPTASTMPPVDPPDSRTPCELLTCAVTSPPKWVYSADVLRRSMSHLWEIVVRPVLPAHQPAAHGQPDNTSRAAVSPASCPSARREACTLGASSSERILPVAHTP